MDRTELVATMNREWKTITLEHMRQQALDTAEGVTFRALRGSDGCRIVVVVCFVDPDRLATMELAPDGNALRWSEWRNAHISDLVAGALVAGHVTTHVLSANRESTNPSISALALIAADPDSIVKLTSLFVIP
jgi:hypothetical protein